MKYFNYSSNQEMQATEFTESRKIVAKTWSVSLKPMVILSCDFFFLFFFFSVAAAS